MKKHGNIVDLIKFIAALLIMAHHLYHIGIENYPLYNCWIYVEFFLLITGYYTAKHFNKLPCENKAKEAITYTIKKFLPIFPYTFMVTICAWATEIILGIKYSGWSWKWILAYYLGGGGEFLFDLLLLSDSFTTPLVEPIWYVSAQLIVFPLFVWFVLSANRYSRMIFCFIVPTMYYGWAGVVGERAFPHDMLRVFSCMMLGVLIFDISTAFGNHIKKISKNVLTIVEVLCMILPIVSSYLKLATYRLDFLFFFIGLLICLPGFSFTARVKSGFLGYLGRLSLPLFVFHWWVGTLIGRGVANVITNKLLLVFLYYASSLILSMIIMTAIERWSWFQKLLNKTIELPE